MSWQDYVNGYLINTQEGATNVCEYGALVGNTDGTVWAKSEGFELKNGTAQIEKEDGSGTETININEFEHLADAFNNGGKTTKKGGIRIVGEKYFVVSFDGERNIMYLKRNGGGAAVAKSNLALVIATFSSKLKLKNKDGVETPQNPGAINQAVETLQKFLIDNNL
jgi:hypothetical protein